MQDGSSSWHAASCFLAVIGLTSLTQESLFIAFTLPQASSPPFAESSTLPVVIIIPPVFHRPAPLHPCAPCRPLRGNANLPCGASYQSSSRGVHSTCINYSEQTVLFGTILNQWTLRFAFQISCSYNMSHGYIPGDDCHQLLWRSHYRYLPGR